MFCATCQAESESVDVNCPAKYGKKLPKGQLRTFDKIWLSKISLVEHAITKELSARHLQTTECALKTRRVQWLWLDAGLEKDQVYRVLDHVKYVASQPHADCALCLARVCGFLRRKEKLEFNARRCIHVGE